MVPLCVCGLCTKHTAMLWHSVHLIAECKHDTARKTDCVQYVSGRFDGIVLWCDVLTHGAVVCLRPVHKTYRDALAQCPFDCRMQA